MESVTIIVLGYNSRPFLEDCFSSLSQMEGISDGVELLFVDNASLDGSADWMREHFPSVRVSENRTNLGFCGGNNAGARQAASEWLAFLNPDMRVSPTWLFQMLDTVRKDPSVDCVASRIMNWDGSLVDFGGASMNFYGYGMQEDIGAPLTTNCEEDRYVLFPCGGAMLIRKDVFLSAGGFDEDYFAFFEDVDLGWRLWVLGYSVKYAGRAVVYHHHHGSWGQVSERYRQRLYERNALASILKNYEDRTLQKILPAALHLMSYRAFLTSNIVPDRFRPPDLHLKPKTAAMYGWLRHAAGFYGRLAWDIFWQQSPKALFVKGIAEARRRLQMRRARQHETRNSQTWAGFDEPPEYGTFLPDHTLAYFEAAQDVLDMYNGIMQKRQAIQAARRRPDREIFPLFGRPLTPNYPDYEYLRALHVLSELWSLYDLFE